MSGCTAGRFGGMDCAEARRVMGGTAPECTVCRLTRERDEARADAERWKARYTRGAGQGVAEILRREAAEAEVERLRATHAEVLRLAALLGWPGGEGALDRIDALLAKSTDPG